MLGLIQLALVSAVAASTAQCLTQKDYAFIVLGDSSLASGTGKESISYGDCIGSQESGPSAEIHNMALRGYNTKRYLDNSTHRALVVAAAQSAVSRGKFTVCSIDFGHIDEKKEQDYHVAHEDFVRNLKTIHAELQPHCSQMVFTTPMMRRWFTPDNKFRPNLEEYASYTRQAAAGTAGALLVDMNKQCLDKWKGDAPKQLLKLNLVDESGKAVEDNSHVGAAGCKVLGNWWNKLYCKAAKPKSQRKHKHKHKKGDSSGSDDSH